MTVWKPLLLNLWNLLKPRSKLQKAMKEEKRALDEATKAYQNGNTTQAEYKAAVEANTKIANCPENADARQLESHIR